MKRVCIGSAPSSGATLLADLLDSVPGTICPPELHIFNHSGAYAFDAEFKSRAMARVPMTPRTGYTKRRPFFHDANFPETGLSEAALCAMIDAADSLPAFVDALADQQAAFRGRKVDVFCEKTSGNIMEAAQFCDTFPFDLFIHISRDPSTAIPSIQRRGYGFYEAVMLWASQNLAGLDVAARPNVHHIRYEDLVDAPFKTVAKLVQQLGLQVTKKTLKDRFATNAYRLGLQTPPCWMADGRRTAIRMYSQDHLSDSQMALLAAVDVRVRGTDSSVRQVPISDIAEQMGYEMPVAAAGVDAEAAKPTLQAERERYWTNSKNVTLQRDMALVVRDPSALPAAQPKRRPKAKSQKPLRILHGVTGQANQPETLAAALRARGHTAHSCTLSRHAFDYETTHALELPRSENWGPTTASLTNLVQDYDVFHFHARSFAWGMRKVAYPSMMDMLWLKSMGKKVFLHFRGSEVRNKALFDRHNPYHFTSDEEDGGLNIFTIRDEVKEQLKEFAEAVCDGVFVVDQEIKQYVGDNAIIVPRAVDDAKLEYTPPPIRKRPLIVHAPSRRGAKGTKHVLAAVEQLNARGIECDLRVVENMSHAEALEVYRAADIVVDQLRLGWYGVLSVEAMALGRPVVCYVRQDLIDRHQLDIPVANANPDTVEAVLERLIENPTERQDLAKRGHAYFRKVHRAKSVVKGLERLYSLCDRPAADVDWVRATHILDAQVAKRSKVDQAAFKAKEAALDEEQAKLQAQHAKQLSQQRDRFTKAASERLAAQSVRYKDVYGERIEELKACIKDLNESRSAGLAHRIARRLRA